MSMGTNVARDSLGLMAQWPVSLTALAIELAIVILAAGTLLRTVFRVDTNTAYLSSFPGHLSFIMGIASSGLGDPRQITIIQVIRILMLTICVPAGALFLPVGEALHTVMPQVMAPQQLALLAALAGLAGFICTRIGVPAGYVLGAMAAATAAKLGGLFDGVLPPPLQTASYVLIGGLIGARFIGITLTEFRQAAVGGVVSTLLTVAIVTVVAFTASLFVAMPFGQIWLGLAPGALEGMGALGVALGYDTAFIAAHHVARLLMLTAVIPLVAFLLTAGKRKRA
jgi:membrane AbrB-like protein